MSNIDQTTMDGFSTIQLKAPAAPMPVFLRLTISPKRGRSTRPNNQRLRPVPIRQLGGPKDHQPDLGTRWQVLITSDADSRLFDHVSSVGLQPDGMLIGTFAPFHPILSSLSTLAVILNRLPGASHSVPNVQG